MTSRGGSVQPKRQSCRIHRQLWVIEKDAVSNLIEIWSWRDQAGSGLNQDGSLPKNSEI